MATAAGKAVVAELRQLFPLLLADGTLAAVETVSKEPVYFPMELPSMQGIIEEAGYIPYDIAASTSPCIITVFFYRTRCFAIPVCVQ